MLDSLDLIIKYFPSVLFILIVLSAGLYGIFRGARKSIILFINAILSLAICLTLFFIFVKSEAVDRMLLTIINNIMGSDTALQEALEINTECNTLRACILDFIPRQMNFMDGLELIVRENGAYLSTLVDLVYRIIFGIVLYIVYLVLVFILYLIYFIFYPERRRKRKMVYKYKQCISDKPYKKHKLVGGMIGVIRGFVSGIIAMSFLGSLFFVVSGGTGSERNPDFEFENEGVNVAYSAYQSISAYGTSGIFKVLNTFKNSKDSPYYLFAADLIFQGDLEDINRGISTNVYFREEVAAYIGFSKDTFNLLLKHGEEELMPVLNGNYDGDPMDPIIEVMTKEEFKTDFKKLIDEFDAKTYFINLTLSFVDSFARNLDKLGFAQDMPSEVLEIMNITFKKGYLSDTIPYEKDLKNKLEAGAIKENEATLGYINASDILSKEDLGHLLDMIFSYLEISNTENIENPTLEVIKAMIPSIKKLSIFNSNKEKLNAVIKRLYAFVDEAYLAAPDESVELSAPLANKKAKLYYIDEAYDSIDWASELVSFLTVAENSLELYTSVYEKEASIYDMLFNIFQKDENLSLFDETAKIIYDSKILGEVLSSELMYKTLENTFTGMIPNFIMPTDINYSNRYDANGILIETGELYQFITSLKIVFTDENNKELFGLMNNEESDKSTSEMASLIVEKLTNEVDGDRLCDRIVESKILHYVLSGFLLNSVKIDGEPLIFTDNSMLEFDSDGNYINVLTKAELSSFFDNSKNFVDSVKPILDDSSNTSAIIDILKDERLTESFDSKLIEGTISHLVVKMLGNDEIIVLPDSMDNKENYISTDSRVSDVKELCLVLQQSTFDVSRLLSSDDTASVIADLTTNDLDILLDSSILHWTISGYLINNKNSFISNLSILIPNTVKLNDKLIDESSLIGLFDNVIPLIPKEQENGTKEEFDTNDLINQILENQQGCLDNDIIATTIAHALVSNDDIKSTLGDMIIIPIEYEDEAQNSLEFEDTYNKTNIWYDELYSLFDSIDILLGEDEIDSLANNMVNNVLKLNDFADEAKTTTKLQIVYESNILLASISNKLDDEIVNNNLISEDINKSNEVIKSCQNEKGYYHFKELESMIDSFTIFNISTDENNELVMDNDTLVNRVTNDILGYNEPCTKIERLNTIPEVQRPTTLNVLYGSGVIRSVLSTQLFDILSNENCLSMTNDDNKYLVDNYDAYFEKEVSSLIKLLNYLGITSDELNNATSEDVDFTLEEKISNNIFDIKNKLDELYENNTYFTGVLFYKELSNNEYIIPNSVYILINSEKSNVITKDEAYNLIDVMDKLDIKFNTESYSFNDFDIDTTSMEEIYASAVIKYYISDELYTALYNEGLFDIAILEGHDYLIKDYNALDDNLECIDGYIRASEAEGLLNFTKKSLNIDISSNLSHNSNEFYLNSLTGDSLESKENRARLNDTLIGQSIMSDKLSKFINSTNNKFLIHTDSAYSYFTEEEVFMLKIYTCDEINSLLSVVSGDINNFKASSVNLNNIKELISANDDNAEISSYLLNASITNEFNKDNNNPIIIPIAAYDALKQIIKPYQMKQFLNALDYLLPTELKGKIEIDSFDSFTIPDEQYFDIISDSIIIRATITQNITVDADVDLICEAAYASKEDALNNKKSNTNNEIAIFAKSETIKIMHSIRAVAGDNAQIKISINDLINATSNDVFESNFVCAILTNYFVSKGFSHNELGASLVEAINIESLEFYNAYIIPSNEMFDVVAAIRGLL